MKKYIYTIQISVNRFYALAYNPETKKLDTLLLPLLHDGKNQGAFLYKTFEKQEEAKLFFELLISFNTASDIEITIEKDLLNEDNITIGNQEIAKFLLKDEEYPIEKVKEFYQNINWDIDITSNNKSI